jgi:hypothetical protein
MPPDEFRTELCDSLTAFYDNILKKSCAGGRRASGQALVPQVRHPDCFRAQPTRGPMPVPSDDANANAVKPPADAASAAPAPQRPLRRKLQRPPKNWRCRRPPPIRAGEVTKLAAGPAKVD